MYTCAYDFLNHGVGEITDEMTIYKYVLKNKTKTKKHSLPDTFCIGRSAFLFFFYCAY